MLCTYSIVYHDLIDYYVVFRYSILMSSLTSYSNDHNCSTVIIQRTLRTSISIVLNDSSILCHFIHKFNYRNTVGIPFTSFLDADQWWWDRPAAWALATLTNSSSQSSFVPFTSLFQCNSDTTLCICLHIQMRKHPYKPLIIIVHSQLIKQLQNIAS